MKRVLKNIAIYTLIFLLVFGTSIDSIAANTPNTDWGNDPDAPDGEDYIQVKIDESVAGTNDYYFEGYHITVTVSSDRLYLESFDTHGDDVFFVYMKGGNGGYFYQGDAFAPYNASVTTQGSDNYSSGSNLGLFCPPNRGGNIPAISHMTFYFKEEEEEEDDDIDLLLIKTVVNDSDLDLDDLEFEFDSTALSETDLMLGDGDDELFEDISEGTVDITESIPDGFELSVRMKVEENGGNGSWEDVQHNDGAVSIPVGDGDDDDDDTLITVEYINEFKPGTLTVEKLVIDPDNRADGAYFDFEVDLLDGFDVVGPVFDLQAGGSKTFDALGTYEITETDFDVQPDSVQVVVTVNGDAGDPILLTDFEDLSLDVDVGMEDVVLVTFTNTYNSSTLIVEKVVVNNTDFPLDDPSFDFYEEGYGDFSLGDGQSETIVENDVENSHLFGVKEDLKDAFTTTYQVIGDDDTPVPHDGEFVPVRVPTGQSKTIRFVNTYNPPVLIVEKEIENPTGATLPVDEFDFDLASIKDFSLGHGEDWSGVVPGNTTLVLTETQIKDFTTMVYVGNMQVMTYAEFLEYDLQVDFGVTLIVKFVNTYNPGRLIIEKEVSDNAPLSSFDVKITGPDDSIYDDTSETIGDPSPKFDEYVPSGSYTIEEMLVASFTSEIMVDLDGGGYVPYTDSDISALVDIDPGQTVKVKFINTYQPPEEGGRIILKKLVVDGHDDDTFDFTLERFVDNVWVELDTPTLGDGGQESYDVPAGQYRITEDLPDHFTLMIQIDDNVPFASTDGVAEFYVDETQTVTLIYENTYHPTSLKIVKQAVGGDEGRTFEFRLDGAIGSDSQEYEDFLLELSNSVEFFEEVEAGQYAIQEVMDENYKTFVSLNGGAFVESLDGLVEITVDAETAVVVVYENRWYDPDMGSLTIRKVVQDTSRNDPFTFRIVNSDLGYDETVTITGAGTKTITGLVPGDYTVTEIGIPSNYDLITANNIEVTVVENEVELVSFTNDYDSPPRNEPDPTRLRIYKDVEGNDEAGDFTFILNGPDYDDYEIELGDGDRFSRTVDAGTYIIQELLQEDYDVEVTVDGRSVPVSELGSVEVDVDDETTVEVRFTNTYNEPEEPETFIEEEVTPQGTPDPIPPEPVEPEIILVEEVPMGLDALPQTGETSPELFYGLGGIISGLGYALRKYLNR